MQIFTFIPLTIVFLTNRACLSVVEATKVNELYRKLSALTEKRLAADRVILKSIIGYKSQDHDLSNFIYFANYNFYYK